MITQRIDWFGRLLIRGNAHLYGERWTAEQEANLLDGLDDEEFEDDNDEARHNVLVAMTQQLPTPVHLEYVDGANVWIYRTKETGAVRMHQTNEMDDTGHAGDVVLSVWREDHWAELLTHHHYPDIDRESRHKHRLDGYDLCMVRLEAWRSCCAILGVEPDKSNNWGVREAYRTDELT